MREGAVTENYFTVPDEISELSSESGATKYLGAVSCGPGYLPPWLRAPSHPFTFLAAADTMVCSVRSLTGTDRSQVLSPGLGHTDTNTLYQRSGLDLRITHSESDFT